MKKQCTASKCRRVFDTAVIVDKKCPYCGKEYPRITLDNFHTQNGMFHYTLILKSTGNQSQLYAAWVIGKVTGWDLLASRDTLTHLPAVLSEGLSRDSAALKKNILEKAGCTVRLVPHQ